MGDIDKAEIEAWKEAIEAKLESRETLIVTLTNTVASLQRAFEEYQIEDDPLGGVTDDPYSKQFLNRVAGGGIDVIRAGETEEFGGHQPHMYVGECDGEVALASPAEEFTREWGMTVWDETDACFYNEYDIVTITDGNIRVLTTDCREKIVCAVDCTELVNPLCE